MKGEGENREKGKGEEFSFHGLINEGEEEEEARRGEGEQWKIDCFHQIIDGIREGGWWGWNWREKTREVFWTNKLDRDFIFLTKLNINSKS